MALQYLIPTGSVSVTASTAKTLIEVPTSASLPFVVYLMEVTSGATSAGALTLTWGTYTATGTGTTVTPQKIGVDQSLAATLGTVKVADTLEPTSFSVGTLPTYLLPLPGMYSILYPFGREIYQPISTLRALRGTCTLSTTVAINLYIEQ